MAQTPSLDSRTGRMVRRRRFRRTRRVAIVCALLALLLVGGPGRGVSAPSGSDSPARSPSARAGPAPSPGALTSGATATSGETLLRGETPPTGDRIADLDPQARDSVFGLLAAARGASGRGELSVAARLLDALDARPVHPSFAAEIESARTALRAAVGEVAARISDDLAAGRALRAAARLEALLSELHPVVDVALDEEGDRRGWPPRLRGASIPAQSRSRGLIAWR